MVNYTLCDTRSLARGVSPELRTALDIIRVLAAVYVVVSHVGIREDTGAFAPALRFGQEAVMAFFLLSGFVIHTNERHRVTNRAGYTWRRALRIYPTLMCAMTISVIVAFWQGDLSQRFELKEALCTLIAMQDAGALKPATICSPFMGNSPLWSLSYEIIFYLIYPFVLPLFLKCPRLTQNAIGVATLTLVIIYSAQPSHFVLLASYFLIWWCGAMMAERCLAPNSSNMTILLPLTYLLTATVIWISAAGASGQISNIGTYPVLMARHFGVAAFFVILALSPLGSWFVARAGRRFQKEWAWWSGISYGLYVFHFPLLIQSDLANNWPGFIVSVGILILASEFGDRRLSRFLRSALGQKRMQTP